MPYEVNFGTLGAAPPSSTGKGSGTFRLAVLGDFSARANRSEVEVGEDLAARKPLRVDVDNLDDMVQRMGLNLQLDIDEEDSTVEVEIGSMDDFHPDELYSNLDIFSELSGLRQRLTNGSSFAKAAKDVQSWLGVDVPKKKRKRRRRSRGTVVAADCKLSDFAALLDREAVEREETPVDDLVRQIVAPHVVAEKDPRQDTLVAAVDSAVSEAMRRVLHHPDFQATEALWRSVDLLTRQLETGSNLKIVLYDITAEELAADLSSAEALEETGLYKLLVEQPAMDAQQGAISAIVGNYVFEQTPPHAELLGRVAKIAAAAKAAFIAAISTECLKKVDSDDVNPMILEAWGALKALPEAAYLALTVPRFMLRNPYGEKTDPIEYFDFEEFAPQYGLKGMLWGNSAILAGLLLGQTFAEQGFKKMDPESRLSVGDMPFYYYTDDDGDQIALPCTERLLNERLAAHVTSQGFLPVLAVRGRPEARLGGFQSLIGQLLAGPWPSSVPAAEKPAAKPAAAPAGSGDSDSGGGGDDDMDALLAGLGGDSGGGGGGGDDDMDALLAGLGGDSDSGGGGGGDDDGDLDALLAGLGDDGDDSGGGGGDDDMDDDLAALLADL